MILWSVKKETDIRRGRHCVFLMHVHLVFVPNTDARFLTMTRQKNYALTIQMYVLILKLNWLKWMANQITSIC
ncbi:transposase [Shigella sp. FC2928]|nr:transposase [Escherichia coli]ODG75497.1 transposase [Shigella sp. FC2045]ODG83820.1 transposase [Shigella sp. FC2928]